jgi:hypothetical protein
LERALITAETEFARIQEAVNEIVLDTAKRLVVVVTNEIDGHWFV